MNAWPAEIQKKLLHVEHYRQFLQIGLAWSRGNECRPNYAEFARRAQLSSRSFVSDVMAGKKRLTIKSLSNFKKGLQLSGAWANYFELLVYQSDADLRPLHLSPEELAIKLEKLRRRLSEKLSTKFALPVDELYTSSQVFDVYASLGTAEHGASEFEILQRTNLPKEQVRLILSHLCKLEFAAVKGDRFFAGVQNLDLEKLGNNFNFQLAYIESLEGLKKRARQMQQHSDELFLHSSLSIEKSQLPLLKKKLRETIYQWMDDHQNEEGDGVLKVTLGMTV